MKPTDADIGWCIEHKELISRWLQERGWWQLGDWYWQPEVPEEVYLLQLPEFLDAKRDADLVWIPTTDDVLTMLLKKKVHPELLSTTDFEKGIVWVASNYQFFVPVPEDCYETPTIALMELLKDEDSHH